MRDGRDKPGHDAESVDFDPTPPSPRSPSAASPRCRRSASCSARASARLPTKLEDAIVIPYAEIPGFPVPSVAGHSGRLVVGELEGKRVALFQGRGHYYERGDARRDGVAIETFKRLGGRTLFLTNAAGGLHAEWRPPALVAITDHINFAGANPLIGLPGDDRFVPMTSAYDPRAAGEPEARRAARRRRAARGRLHVVLRPVASRRRRKSAPPRSSAPISSACRPCRR